MDSGKEAARQAALEVLSWWEAPQIVRDVIRGVRDSDAETIAAALNNAPTQTHDIVTAFAWGAAVNYMASYYDNAVWAASWAKRIRGA